MKKKIFYSLLAIVFLMQALRPEKNLSDDNTHHISNKYQIPENIVILLEAACYDCHSNKTFYPVYAEIQPVGWWLANHVNEGKKHLNFAAFTNRPIAVQNHKLEEMVEMLKEKEMPLPSYTWFSLHQNARLSDDQRKELIDWTSAQLALLKTQYPADSLELKRKKS
jgi:hypothetical protein